MPRRQSSPLPSDMPNRSIKDELEVSIVDFDTSDKLPQIHVSKTQLANLIRTNRYVIFPAAEQRFGIQITVHDAFEWGNANALEITLGFDQGNTVNEKSVFLVRPMRNVKTSDLRMDNALLEMWSQGSDLTCCIDQILIQDPAACEGRVNAFSFRFSDVRKGDELVPSTHREKPRNSVKISDHQGKIRIEVTRKIIRAGGQRQPGLHDSLTKGTRPSTQTLLKHDISLEIGLDKFKHTGSLDYGSAFRSAACKSASQYTKIIFEFLYRNVDLLDEIVCPEFRAEIADHRLFHPSALSHLHSGAAFGVSSLQSPCATSDDEHVRMVNMSPAFSSQIGDALVTPPTSATMKDSGDRHGELRSRMATTISSNLTDTPDVISPWRSIEEALTRCEDQNREDEEDDQHAESVLRDELEQLHNWERKSSTDLLRHRLQLDQEEEQLYKRFTDCKAEIELKLARLKEQRATREAKLATAAEVFMSSLCKLKKRKHRA